MQTRLILILVAMLACLGLGAVPARAVESPTVEVAGSYVFLHGVSAVSDYPAGWLVSGGWYFDRRWVAIGEVGGSYDTLHPIPGAPLPDLRASTYDFTGGVRFVPYPNRTARPFVQVLFGGARFTDNFGGDIHHFAWQPGGGVDVKLTDALAIRLQGDYRLIPFDTVTVKSFRATAGLVFSK